MQGAFLTFTVTELKTDQDVHGVTIVCTWEMRKESSVGVKTVFQQPLLCVLYGGSGAQLLQKEQRGKWLNYAHILQQIIKPQGNYSHIYYVFIKNQKEHFKCVACSKQ